MRMFSTGIPLGSHEASKLITLAGAQQLYPQQCEIKSISISNKDNNKRTRQDLSKLSGDKTKESC
jgi:hypothetical protein